MNGRKAGQDAKRKIRQRPRLLARRHDGDAIAGQGQQHRGGAANRNRHVGRTAPFVGVSHELAADVHRRPEQAPEAGDVERDQARRVDLHARREGPRHGLERIRLDR